MSKVKFKIGVLVATPGALNELALTGESPHEFVNKHLTGDWGCLCDDDKKANEMALKNGGRIFSAYLLKSDEKIWIITEADRSSTCILLPSEY